MSISHNIITIFYVSLVFTMFLWFSFYCVVDHVSMDFWDSKRCLSSAIHRRSTCLSHRPVESG